MPKMTIAPNSSTRNW